MGWVYQQISGRLYAPDGKFMTLGYSGHDDGVNNPKFEQEPNHGPIPRGNWRIGSPFDSSDHGPHVMRLMPEPGTETYGRSGFLIHGDSKEHPGQGVSRLHHPAALRPGSHRRLRRQQIDCHLKDQFTRRLYCL